ncbi:class A beta-lactamase [Amycolatopsis antarctica]|uniref:class A beta-lactamase n=1 Tax=Amycolatopsis antarctica TaxID=1854586 RepID=UPI003B836293
MTRRRFLTVAALLPLAGCSAPGRPASDVPAPASSSSTPSAPASVPEPGNGRERLAELERRFDARLGLYALDTGSGSAIEYRADERFAFCSTFKGLAVAAVLSRNPPSHVDTVVTYTEDDLLKSAVVTEEHVATGMTIGGLCDAAIRYSDGTAANLLVRDLGGPAELTEYARGLGDTVTRMDRIEPAITEAIPGDPRDTTSPRAFAADYRAMVLGEALPAGSRDFLRDLLERNTTGAKRIRAGVPDDWVVADKTGTGDYGTVNDIAIVWPPGSAPLVIAAMSSKATRDAGYEEALLAEAAAHVVATLT